LEYAQRPDSFDFTKGAGFEGAAVDLERRAAAVGRVGKDIVDREVATEANVR